MSAGVHYAEIFSEEILPTDPGRLRFPKEGRGFRSPSPQFGKQGGSLQSAFGGVLVLDVGEHISQRGLCYQLLFDLLQIGLSVVTLAQPVAAERCGDNVRRLEFIALGHTQRRLMLPKQVEDLACKPRCMAKLKGNAQRCGTFRRSLFEKSGKPLPVRFEIWRQLE